MTQLHCDILPPNEKAFPQAFMEKYRVVCRNREDSWAVVISTSTRSKGLRKIENRIRDRFYILKVEIHSVIGLLMVHTKSCSVGGTIRCAHQLCG